MGNNSGSQTNICADSLQFVKPRHLSTSEELSLTKQSLSDGSESSTTCTSPAGRLSLKIDGMRSVGVKTENSTLTEPSISPFSIYNNITHPINNNEVDNMFSDEEPKNKPEADDYKAMESRILSFFSDNKIEVIDLQDELRQSVMSKPRLQNKLSLTSTMNRKSSILLERRKMTHFLRPSHSQEIE